MNYTANYHLTQWEKDDHIMMDDFNENNAKIDAALANTRRVIGTYIGDGTNKANDGQEISLGFRPGFVIVSGNNTEQRGFYYCSAVIAEDNSDCGRLTDSGFRAWTNSYANNPGDLNADGVTYWYVAFA